MPNEIQQNLMAPYISATLSCPVGWGVVYLEYGLSGVDNGPGIDKQHQGYCQPPLNTT